MALVLVVDDDPQVRSVLLAFVKNAGHDVISAVNGKEALACLDQNVVDLILLDIIMPEMDGIGTIMELKNRQNCPRIIAISGGAAKLDQDYVLMLANTMKVDAVLAKPISYEELTKTIVGVLEKADQ